MEKLARARADAQEPKSKYRSLAQFVQGVGAVNEPCLSDKERLALNCLSAHADYRTGGGAHPGNATLSCWCGCNERNARKNVARLITLKLIERTSAGCGGRGLASVYRICIEDPRFPEPKSASHRLQVPELKPAPDQERVSDSKPGLLRDLVSGDENQVSKTKNPVFGNQKPGLLRDHTSFTSNRDSSDSRLHSGEMPLKVVEKECVPLDGRRRRHRANPKSDDDEKSAHTPETLPVKQSHKLTSQFRAWMRQRILARAGRQVENEHAYVRACEPEFLENLAAEVEEYLQQLAVREFRTAIEGAPRDASGNFSVQWTPIAQFLWQEAQKYGLQIDRDAIRRACKYANDACGLRENSA